jgi:hypothetical protein
MRDVQEIVRATPRQKRAVMSVATLAKEMRVKKFMAKAVVSVCISSFC